MPVTAQEMCSHIKWIQESANIHEDAAKRAIATKAGAYILRDDRRGVIALSVLRPFSYAPKHRHSTIKEYFVVIGEAELRTNQGVRRMRAVSHFSPSHKIAAMDEQAFCATGSTDTFVLWTLECGPITENYLYLNRMIGSTTKICFSTPIKLIGKIVRGIMFRESVRVQTCHNIYLH